MCGLFGFRMVREPGTDGAFLELATISNKMTILMDDRGGDSWGSVEIGVDGATVVSRGMGEAFTSSKDWGHPAYIRLGHTRYATCGAKILKNAHPFEYGSILGMHNGAIYNHFEVGHYDVDSEALIDSIAVGEYGKGLEGYGAVQWWDVDSENVYICRMANGQLEAKMITLSDGSRLIAWLSDWRKFEAPAGVSIRSMPKLSEGRVYLVHSDGSLRNTGKRIDIEVQWETRNWEIYPYRSFHSRGYTAACVEDVQEELERDYSTSAPLDRTGTEIVLYLSSTEAGTEHSLVIPEGSKVFDLARTFTHEQPPITFVELVYMYRQGLEVDDILDIAWDTLKKDEATQLFS